jgi:hypothetical protein
VFFANSVSSSDQDFYAWLVRAAVARGTIVLTAPTGYVYRSEPHGASMFPALAQPTGELNL